MVSTSTSYCAGARAPLPSSFDRAGEGSSLLCCYFPVDTGVGDGVGAGAGEGGVAGALVGTVPLTSFFCFLPIV